jgi:hypothetical protein
MADGDVDISADLATLQQLTTEDESEAGVEEPACGTTGVVKPNGDGPAASSAPAGSPPARAGGGSGD